MPLMICPSRRFKPSLPGAILKLICRLQYILNWSNLVIYRIDLHIQEPMDSESSPLGSWLCVFNSSISPELKIIVLVIYGRNFKCFCKEIIWASTTKSSRVYLTKAFLSKSGLIGDLGIIFIIMRSKYSPSLTRCSPLGPVYHWVRVQKAPSLPI